MNGGAGKLVDRLIWKELMGPLAVSFLLFLVILFNSVLMVPLTDLMVKGASLGLVAKYAAYGLPMLVTMCLPMAMLLGSLLAFGRLSGDSEHIALFASGVSFTRIARPVALVGLAVSILTFIWNETVVPPATRQFYNFKRNVLEDIQESNRPISYPVMGSGKDADRVDEWVYIDGGYDPKTQMLRKVTIVKMGEDRKRRGRPVLVLYADRAVFRGDDPSGLNADFFDAYIYVPNPDQDPKTRMDTYFKVLGPKDLPERVKLGRTFKGVMQAGGDDNRTMTFGQLRDKINTKARDSGPQTTLGDQVDLWGKFSVPLASIIFGLVGAPLGIRPQRGSRTLGFSVAILIIFLYWLVYNWMYQVGRGGGLPPAIASFSADILGIGAAAFLIARTRQ